MAALSLADDKAAEADRDTLAPLPAPTAPCLPWGAMSVAGGGSSVSVAGGLVGPASGAGSVVGGAAGAAASVAGSGAPHIPYYPTGYAPMSYSYSSDPLAGSFAYGAGHREGSVHSGSGTSFSNSYRHFKRRLTWTNASCSASIFLPLFCFDAGLFLVFSCRYQPFFVELPHYDP